MNQNPNTPVNQTGNNNMQGRQVVSPGPQPNMQGRVMPNPNGQVQQPAVNNASQFIKEGNNQPQAPKKKKKVMSRELVTILGVIAIVAILYFTYNYQLNKNLELKTNIPIAARKIKAGTRITDSDITRIEVPSSTLNNVQAITDVNELIGKYVNYDTIIPEHSFFYKDAISATDTSPNSIFKDLVEQDAAIMIEVNLEKTYGNSIMPGDIVDIYADAIKTNNKGVTEYITGPLVTGAKVLAVLDSAGENVFADHENKLYPAYFVFTLDSEIINLIRKAQKLSSSQYAMSIYPVVDGKSYTGNGVTQVNESQIVDLIKTATIDVKENN